MIQFTKHYSTSQSTWCTALRAPQVTPATSWPPVMARVKEVTTRPLLSVVLGKEGVTHLYTQHICFIRPNNLN